MDINSLRTAFLDHSSVLDHSLNRSRNAAGDISSFEQLLRRTVEPEQAAEERPAPSAAPESASGVSRFATIDRESKLFEQCLELEIFLVKTLISSMRSTVQKSGLIDEGFAGKMYEDMLYDEYAREFTKNANFGMAELAYLELTGQRGKIIR